MMQIVSLFEATAPSLQDLRSEPEGSTKGRQELMDADIVVGGIVALVAVAATYATASVLPVIMFGGAFAIVSLWHHLVLNSAHNY
jgi:hypothetical protein